MTDIAGMAPDRAATLARTVLATAGPGPDASSEAAVLVGALAAALPSLASASREQVAREYVLLRGLLGPTAAEVALALCLARPVDEPVWADFRRLTTLFDQLHAELRRQRRRTRIPGPVARRAAREAAGTTAVLARAAAEFSAVWCPRGSAAVRSTPS